MIEKLENLSWLDFENSIFIIEEYGFKKDDITIKSVQDYHQKSIEAGDMAVIIIEKIKTKPGFIIDTDMFILPFLTEQIFISEKLKAALEEGNLTGILIEEAFE